MVLGAGKSLHRNRNLSCDIAPPPFTPVRSRSRSLIDDIIAVEPPRSIEQVCVDLRSRYEKQPSPRLKRMLEQLQTEIAARQPPTQLTTRKRPRPILCDVDRGRAKHG